MTTPPPAVPTPETPDAVATAPAVGAPTEEPKGESGVSKFLANVKTIAGAVLLALVIRTCLFEAFEIEGPSMEPTLLNGDRVVVSKYSFGLFLPLRPHADVVWSSPKLGDVVIIKSPADGVDIVKRVIGIGGDYMEVRSDRIYRNGVALPSKALGPCVEGTGATQEGCKVYESKVGDEVFRYSTGMVIYSPRPREVPPGHIYVLGDHRDHSNDSRNPMVGAIPLNRVKGRALAIYWSNGGDGEGLRLSRMFSAVR
jgi:signal peptidase I